MFVLCVFISFHLSSVIFYTQSSERHFVQLLLRPLLLLVLRTVEVVQGNTDFIDLILEMCFVAIVDLCTEYEIQIEIRQCVAVATICRNPNFLWHGI